MNETEKKTPIGRLATEFGTDGGHKMKTAQEIIQNHGNIVDQSKLESNMRELQNAVKKQEERTQAVRRTQAERAQKDNQAGHSWGPAGLPPQML